MSTLAIENIEHTNGTNAMTINSDAVVSLPNIPYLIANTAASKNVAPGGYTGTIIYDNVISSRGISLNTTTGTFTVPLNGLYEITASARLNSNLTYAYWQLINDDATSTVQGNKLIMTHGSTAGFTTPNGSAMYNLVASTNYKITVGANSSSSVAVSEGQTWLDIKLIG